MVWIQFLLSAAVLVYTAIKLAEYGDVIAVRTGLSGMFIGTLLIAGATSLPELLAAINAIDQGVPNLAAGSMFGSSMFNMFVLAILDLILQNARILRKVAMNHALAASLANMMTGLAIFFILANLDLKIGWVGVDSLLIMAVYIGGVRILQGNGPPPAPEQIDDEKVPSLRRAGIGFGIATLILVLATPYLVSSANAIADQTGISAGFIGATLLAATTSLPELVTTIAAARIGAYDLAVGNLFGSNIFNMFALGLTDFFYTPGRFLGAIDPGFALVGLLGLLLTGMGLIGNLARVDRRLVFVEVDALLIFLVYFAGMWFLYSQGIGVEAVLQAIRKDGYFDALIAAGDLSLGGSDPAGCIDRLREAGVQAVFGNTDKYLTEPENPPPDELHRKKWGHLRSQVDWALPRLGLERLAWLNTLPFDLRFSPPPDFENDLLIFHANPKNIIDFIFPPPDEQPRYFNKVLQADDNRQLARLMGGTTAQTCAFGHLHLTYTRFWRDYTLVNVAPCSLPAIEKDPRARYTIFEWNGTQWEITRRFVEYDYHQEVRALQVSQMPFVEDYTQAYP
jgi:cation:H+ antiporter